MKPNKLICAALLVVNMAAAHAATWPTHYQHFTEIRRIAKETPEGTAVRFTLNNGDVVFGHLLKYEAYTDYVWYQPRGTGRNIFAQDAFAIHELMALDVLSIEI